MDIAAHFGKNLRRCRRRAGLSQEELGLRTSLYRTEIGLFERGGRIPRIDTLVKLSAALGIPPRELIEGIEWKPGTTTGGSFRLAPPGGPHSS
jgi:transcriptional regulator with XRE-family HTH domain